MLHYRIFKFAILWWRYLAAYRILSGVQTKLNIGAQELSPISNNLKTTSKFQRLLGEVAVSNFTAQKHD